jgi:hypothetical protein
MRRHEAETLSVSAERERDWRAFVCPVSMQIKAERVAKVETRGRGCFELGAREKPGNTVLSLIVFPIIRQNNKHSNSGGTR